MNGKGLALLLASALVCGGGASPSPPSRPPLVLERSIPLPDVRGRIDHLAIDPAGGRLFVAALGADRVEVVDLRQGRRLTEIAGQSAPQGLAWLADRRQLVVASADGQVGFYGGDPLKPLGVMRLGDDADNVRLAPGDGRPVVGYGAGALAVLDPATRTPVATIKLPGHPESFRFDGGLAYVNVPDAARIIVADLASGREIAAWPTPGARWNFAMALDAPRRLLAVVFRLPAKLRLIDLASGRTVADLATCGDVDDLFFDSPRRRIYAVCGSGAVDVFQATTGADYTRIGRMTTRAGARTGLFAPETDRLYVAARAADGEPATILVYRPSP
jgi:DNA-binding beta-propeller fold protein YncE